MRHIGDQRSALHARLDTETRLVLWLVDDLFRAQDPNWPEELKSGEVDWQRALTIACRNRVVFRFAREALNSEFRANVNLDPQTMATLREILREGEVQRSKLQRTLRFLVKTLGEKVQWIVMKSEEPFPHVTHDVDILLRTEEDYEHALSLLTQQEGKLSRDDRYKSAYIHPELLRIEPHLAVSWYGLRFFDNDFMFRSPHETRICGTDVLVPEPSAALGVELAHSVFDCGYILIRGLVTMCRLLDTHPDWESIQEQAKKFGWNFGFEYSMGVLMRFCAMLYHKGMEGAVAAAGLMSRNNLPYWYPPHVLLRAFIERIRAERKQGRRPLYEQLKWVPVYYAYKRLRSLLPLKRHYVHSWLY